MVTRTAKDGQLRMVFWNEVKPSEEGGGMQVEKGQSRALGLLLTVTDDLSQNFTICGIRLRFRMRLIY